MRVGTGAPFDRQRRRGDGSFDLIFCEGELALGRQRQGASVARIARPILDGSDGGKHITQGFVAIGTGLGSVSTQRVDARAQRDGESGDADPLTRMTLL
jgi:hypothetical protein